jgi:hypothetical protein
MLALISMTDASPGMIGVTDNGPAGAFASRFGVRLTAAPRLA